MWTVCKGGNTVAHYFLESKMRRYNYIIAQHHHTNLLDTVSNIIGPKQGGFKGIHYGQWFWLQKCILEA